MVAAQRFTARCERTSPHKLNDAEPVSQPAAAVRIPISSSLRLKVRSSDWRRWSAWRHGSNGVEQTTHTSKTGHVESNTNCGGAWRLAWTKRQTSQCISGQTEFFVSSTGRSEVRTHRGRQLGDIRLSPKRCRRFWTSWAAFSSTTRCARR